LEEIIATDKSGLKVVRKFDMFGNPLTSHNIEKTFDSLGEDDVFNQYIEEEVVVDKNVLEDIPDKLKEDVVKKLLKYEKEIN